MFLQTIPTKFTGSPCRTLVISVLWSVVGFIYWVSIQVCTISIEKVSHITVRNPLLQGAQGTLFPVIREGIMEINWAY